MKKTKTIIKCIICEKYLVWDGRRITCSTKCAATYRLMNSCKVRDELRWKWQKENFINN